MIENEKEVVQAEGVENTVPETKTENKAENRYENRNDRNDRNDRWRKNRRDGRRDQGDKKEDGLDKKMVAINRVSKTVKGGRNMRFNALVVVGDHSGRVGVGMGKAAEVPMAIEKATVDAKRRMHTIALSGTTIPHEVVGRFETSKVIMKPAKEGNGVIAGGSVRAVVELVGIKDITTKLYGSNNPVNCVKATLEGLKLLKNAETVARLRGKTAEEI